MPMTFWANKTCGCCGLVSPDNLEKRHCPKCDTDKCPRCFGGNPLSPMCKDCAFQLQQSRTPRVQ